MEDAAEILMYKARDILRHLRIESHAALEEKTQKKRHVLADVPFVRGWRLRVSGESEFVDVNRIRCFVLVAIDLVVDRHSIPRRL